jgi:dipeptidyl-peptidase-4
MISILPRARPRRLDPLSAALVGLLAVSLGQTGTSATAARNAAAHANISTTTSADADADARASAMPVAVAAHDATAQAATAQAPAQAAQPAATSAAPDRLSQDLTRIFASGDLFARGFGPAAWLDDAGAYLTVEPSATNGTWPEIVQYDAATGTRQVLIAAASLVPAGATLPLRFEQYAFSPDKTHVLLFANSRKVWRQNTRGDYWILDRTAPSPAPGAAVPAAVPSSASASAVASDATGGAAMPARVAMRKLGGDAAPSTLMFAKFSPDGRRVAYVRDHDLYVEDVSTGAITRLTSDGSATIINGTSDWVYEEELDLRDAFRWSPDSARIAYWRFDSTGVGIFALVDNAAGVYPQVALIPYPKAGTTNSAVTVGVVAATGGPTTWVDLPGDPRQHYIARMDWAANASELAIQRLNRLQNRNDLLLADASTGHARPILQEQDEAWVDVQDDVTWLDKGAKFLWLSERDGWRRLYAVSRDGAKLTPLTSAAADVMQVVATDPKGEWVYYIAAPANATQRQLLRVRTDGRGKPELLTVPGANDSGASAKASTIMAAAASASAATAAASATRAASATARGTHAYQISADCKWAIHVVSTFDQPPVFELIRLPSHQVVRVLEDNARLRENAATLLATQSEFFKVDVGDGVTLDGWMLRPPDFDPAKRYPTLVYVYGEPANATVTDSWGGQRALFHRALARDGFIVVSVDNRGTPAPKGRAWRKVVYGSVGVLSAKEQAAAIRTVAASHPFIDTTRLAIWGWSGGASNTLNVMFRVPGLFQVGIAVAPVPDQRLYDTIYQERYMGLPAENVEGYRTGSPINFADALQGRLLLVHGSGDDNVHIQGTERLVNRLIALGKPFDYFVYPGRTHAINEGPGTSLHIYSLIARYLKEHLPPPPVSTRE